MDPASVGLAAAVLLASKFGERFAQDAGASGWKAVNRLQAVIARKFRGDSEAEAAVAELEASPVDGNRSEVATHIAAAARADAVFSSEIEQLVSLAREDGGMNSLVAQSFDQSKQANIRGDNFGSINF